MFRFASVLGVVSFAVAALSSARFGAVEMALRALAAMAAGVCAGCVLYPALRGAMGRWGDGGGERRSQSETPKGHG